MENSDKDTAEKAVTPETQETNGKQERGKDGVYTHPQWRHLFMLALSAAVIGVVLFVSYEYGSELFHKAVQYKTLYLVPYLTNLAGVLIWIMNTSRKKSDRWKLRDHWGDHCFRVAQSFAYLFIVLWAWNSASKGGAVATDFSPNILGFLVGLFILRVERAMEGLGDKFEEALTAVLPRATQYVSAEERRRRQLKMVYKVDDITTQYDVLRGQLADRAARDKFDRLLDEAQSAVVGEDPEKLKASIDRLTREFDDIKKSASEILVPLEDLLGQTGKEKKTNS